MKCDKCGKPIGGETKVADVEIDLDESERYSLLWCERCVNKEVEN